MVALAENCRKLETFDLQYCTRLTGAGIRAFSGHKYLKLLKLFHLTNLDESDVEQVALGCPSLQSVVLDYSLTRKFEFIDEKARRVIKHSSYFSRFQVHLVLMSSVDSTLVIV